MIIEVPEANGMPYFRWEAYMIATATNLGYPKGTYSYGSFNGMSRLTIKDEHCTKS